MPPLPTPDTPPARIQIQAVQPQVDCGRYPVKRDERRPGRRLGDDLQGRPRHPARGRPLPAAGARSGWRRRSSRSATTAGKGRLRGDGARPLAVHGRGVGRPYATLLDELDRKLAAGQADLAGELAEGRRSSAPATSTTLARGGAELGAKDRHGKTSLREAARGRRRARARPLRRLVRALPALLGRLRGRREGAAPSWPSSASTSSTCRRSTRSGRRTARAATTRSWRRRAIPAARGRSAGRRAVTTRSTPSSGRWRTSTGWSRRREARARDRARLRDPVLARPPVAARAPGVVQPPAGRDAQVRREPAQALPGHLQRQLRLRGLAGLWEALRDVVLHWCRHGVRVFRVDNPHTKSVPFWEWLIAEVRARVPGHDLPSRRRSRGRR